MLKWTFQVRTERNQRVKTTLRVCRIGIPESDPLFPANAPDWDQFTHPTVTGEHSCCSLHGVCLWRWTRSRVMKWRQRKYTFKQKIKKNLPFTRFSRLQIWTLKVTRMTPVRLSEQISKTGWIEWNRQNGQIFRPWTTSLKISVSSFCCIYFIFGVRGYSNTNLKGPQTNFSMSQSSIYYSRSSHAP